MSPDDHFEDIVKEIARVLKDGGYFIGAIPDEKNSVLEGAERSKDGSMVIRNDPFKIRDGVRWMVPHSRKEVRKLLSPYFENIRVGHLSDDYYGLMVSGFIFVCCKKGDFVAETRDPFK
jgi:hypothetical protein